MKRKLFVAGMLVFAFIFGCSQVDNGGMSNGSVRASLPSGFDVVSQDKIQWGSVYKAKDIETGCYWMLGRTNNGDSSSVSGSIEQIFIEKDGVSVPYCD